MKSIGCVVYEVDINEIRMLPNGWQVLQHDALYGRFRLMHVGEDTFRQEGKRFTFFVFKVPSPQVSKEYLQGAAGV